MWYNGQIQIQRRCCWKKEVEAMVKNINLNPYNWIDTHDTQWRISLSCVIHTTLLWLPLSMRCSTLIRRSWRGLYNCRHNNFRVCACGTHIFTLSISVCNLYTSVIDANDLSIITGVMSIIDNVDRKLMVSNLELL